MGNSRNNKRWRLYSKESWEKVNEDNKFLLEDYLMELEAEGRAKSTINQYYSDIRGFFCYLHDYENNIYILDADRRLFRNFYIKYQRNNTSPARINRHQSALREMLQYASDNEEDYDYPRNAMSTIKSLENVPVAKSIWLSDEEVMFLIDYYKKRDEYREATFISLSYDSAGRRDEVYQVEKHNFLKDNINYTNKVEGKRGKIFPLVFSERTRKLALKYLEQRGEDDIDSLWVTGVGDEKEQVSYNTLYYWVKKLVRPLQEFNEGVLKNFSPHDLRRSSLENFENGTHSMLEELGQERLDIEIVRQLAQHQSIDTTKNFYLVDKSEEEFKNLFGLNE